MVVGLAIDFPGLDAVKMLFGRLCSMALAPPLILLVVLLTSNSRVMGERVNSFALRISGVNHLRADERRDRWNDRELTLQPQSRDSQKHKSMRVDELLESRR